MNRNMSVYKPDWLEAKERMTDWWAGKKVDRVVGNVVAPENKKSQPAYINKHPERLTDADTVFHNLDLMHENTFWGGEAFPYHFVYFGAMYGSMVHFGATPNFANNTTWYEPCFNNLDDIIAYKPDPDNNKWRQMAVDMRKKSVARSGGRYTVVEFGILAAIDTLAGLLGNEKLLYAMIDEPEKVIAARDYILQFSESDFYKVYNELSDCNDNGCMDWLCVWGPGKWITNQCDFSVMISPEMFDKFVFDDLNINTARYGHDYASYHLDGEGEIKHLDSILKIDKLRLIQWVPVPNERQHCLNWIELFKRIQNAGCNVYITVDPSSVKKLLNKIDRELVYLNVACPNKESAIQALRDMEWK